MDDCVLHCLLYFLLVNVPTLVFKQVFLQFLCAPHVTLDVKGRLLALLALSNGVVCQVGVHISQLVVRVVVTGESDIGFCVHPDRKRIPRLDQDPLPDVKFALFYDKLVFDVLLGYPLGFLIVDVVQDLYQILEQNNTAASAH